MKHMKKSIIVFGAITIAILMVSTATAVETVNSEPAMDYVEQLEQAQNLPGIYEELSSLDIDELTELNESIPPEYIEELWNYFRSVEFANLMHEDEIQSFLYSDKYLEFFNGEDVQNFVNSDEYAVFLNSDTCQIFLDNYFDNTNSFDDGTSSLMLEGQEVSLNLQFQQCGLPVGTSNDGSVEVDESSSGTSTSTSNGNPETTGYFIDLLIYLALCVVVGFVIFGYFALLLLTPILAPIVIPLVIAIACISFIILLPFAIIILVLAALLGYI